MTAGDLIRELQRYPAHLPVKVLLNVVMIGVPEGEPQEQPLSPEDALEADAVIFEGSHILIESVG